MARGWESKSVEAQQAEAGEAKSSVKPRLTREEARLVREKEGLRLARQRVLEQLKSNPGPPHKQMLEAALRQIETKLVGLELPPGTMSGQAIGPPTLFSPCSHKNRTTSNQVIEFLPRGRRSTSGEGVG